MENNPTDHSYEKSVIEEAIKRASEQGKKRKLILESNQPVEDLDSNLDIPEELEEPGKHSLQEANILARYGKGTHSFDFLGNTITLKSLDSGEELEALARSSTFPPTAQNMAFNLYVIAMALDSVNGKPYFKRLPFGPDDDIIYYKFNEILKLSDIVRTMLITEYQKLKGEMQEKAIYAKKE